jgi:hypothetical protein
MCVAQQRISQTVRRNAYILERTNHGPGGKEYHPKDPSSSFPSLRQKSTSVQYSARNEPFHGKTAVLQRLGWDISKTYDVE